jgi:putative sigma-54 modulation protein
LSVEKNRQITEIALRVGKLFFTAKEQSIDLYASIDLAIDKLDRQLKKQKEISKIRRKNNLKILNKKLNMRKISSYDVTEDSTLKISKVQRFDLKPANIEDAIYEMDNLGYKAYMFKDEGSRKISVLYRDNDNSLVLLESN